MSSCRARSTPLKYTPRPYAPAKGVRRSFFKLSIPYPKRAYVGSHLCLGPSKTFAALFDPDDDVTRGPFRFFPLYIYISIYRYISCCPRRRRAIFSFFSFLFYEHFFFNSICPHNTTKEWDLLVVSKRFAENTHTLRPKTLLCRGKRAKKKKDDDDDEEEERVFTMYLFWGRRKKHRSF